MKITQTPQFKKDVKKQRKRGKDLQKLKEILGLLISQEALPAKNRDHALTGDWVGWRDCHVEPNWLLIYKVSPGEVFLGRTGSHADLF